MSELRGYHLGKAKFLLVEKALEHLQAGEKIQDISLRQVAREIGLSLRRPISTFSYSRRFYQFYSESRICTIIRRIKFLQSLEPENHWEILRHLRLE
jgi:hypothetical protein